MSTITTVDGDMLDRLCQSAYKSQHPAVEAVLDRHYELSGGVSLADRGVDYSSGQIIHLPLLSDEVLRPVSERRTNVFDSAYIAAQNTSGWPS